VPDFCSQWNWGATFILFAELRCHISVACGIAPPHFSCGRNWGATPAKRFRAGRVLSCFGTGVPNWGAKWNWHPSSYEDKSREAYLSPGKRLPTWPRLVTETDKAREAYLYANRLRARKVRISAGRFGARLDLVFCHFPDFPGLHFRGSW